MQTALLTAGGTRALDILGGRAHSSGTSTVRVQVVPEAPVVDALEAIWSDVIRSGETVHGSGGRPQRSSAPHFQETA
jgi:hypothetical protein